MIAVWALLLAADCQLSSLTLQQAQQLALAAPNIEAAVIERHAEPRFEWITSSPGGWSFDINSASPCAHLNPCSTLMGHFAVNRRTGEVENLDADGGSGAVVSSSTMKQLLRQLNHGRCRSGRRR
jgi:hypothetical protein